METCSSRGIRRHWRRCAATSSARLDALPGFQRRLVEAPRRLLPGPDSGGRLALRHRPAPSTPSRFPPRRAAQVHELAGSLLSTGLGRWPPGTSTSSTGWRAGLHDHGPGPPHAGGRHRGRRGGRAAARRGPRLAPRPGGRLAPGSPSGPARRRRPHLAGAHPAGAGDGHRHRARRARCSVGAVERRDFPGALARPGLRRRTPP